MASKSGDVTDEEDVDVDAEARLQTVTLGMKQQADELLLANQLDKALTLYRELLMHVTRSQVTLLQQKELVISCRMNVLAALSKARKWSGVVTEAAETLAVFAELREAQQRQKTTETPSGEHENDHQVLARAYYFRGFAYMKMGSLLPAQQDFRRALELNPDDEIIQNDYKELQTAVQAEQRVKQSLATSMKFFQTGKYQSAVEACLSALRESQQLQKTELTGLIHGNLAAIYVKMKDDAKAIEHYKRTMLITRCCDKPTAAQNERVYDILDSLAGCYSRKRDYSSALSVIGDQIKLLPACPERKDREAMMYLNGGRICYTMGRYSQAVEHLEKGSGVAKTTSTQLDVTLNCAFWLGKAYAKNNETDKAVEILGVAISAAEKKAEAATITDLLEKLLLERLELLELDTSLTRSLRLEQLWHTFEYFDKKRRVYGHVRSAVVLAHVLSLNKVIESDEERSEMMRVLQVVDRVNVGKLSTSEATAFMELALKKVDLMVTRSPVTTQAEVKSFLVKLLRDLEYPGGANPSCRQQLRAIVLRKLMGVAKYVEEEESDEDVKQLVEGAIDSLRSCKATDEAGASDVLEVLLPRVGQWKAARGDLVGAEEILEETVELFRESPDGGLYESLVGLCVVQIRLGMLEEATQVLKEIDMLPEAQNANELSIIKSRLQAAVTSQSEKQMKVEESKKAHRFEKQPCATEGGSFLCGIGQVWWARWCGPLLACVTAVAVALIFA